MPKVKQLENTTLGFQYLKNLCWIPAARKHYTGVPVSKKPLMDSSS
jgi:hypothetical protein